MDPSTQLFALLDDLSEALDDGDDLVAILGVLTDDLRAGTVHYLGFELTVDLAGNTVTVADVVPGEVGSRLSITLTAGETAEQREAPSRITFYSGAPGAFDTLAANARTMLGPNEKIDLDLDPGLDGGDIVGAPRPDAQTQRQELADRSAINQAIGVLIEGGFPPAQAQQELQRRAQHANVTVIHTARHLLCGMPAPRTS